MRCPSRRHRLTLAALLCLGHFAAAFQFPTANRALLERGSEAKFYAPTSAGNPWEGGSFGCTRTGGRQWHEGIDILAVQKDRRGEPADPILATTAGEVAHVSRKPSLSNYGNYIVLRHNIGGIELVSLYAHLASIDTSLKPGVKVSTGQQLGVMGRTTNTRESISRERAHLHFEIGIQVNERFPQWYARHRKGQRNDHGAWNGQNIIGLDPAAMLLARHRAGDAFSLRDHLRAMPELCRVFVRAEKLSLADRMQPLVVSNPRVKTEGLYGYEIALSTDGIPLVMIPRTKSEYPVSAKLTLLRVDDGVARADTCRKLLTQRSGKWQLSTAGSDLLSLMVY